MKWTITVILFTLHLQAVWADLFQSFGASPRGISLAGSGSAVVEGYDSTYYNVAGLAAPRKPVPNRKIRFVRKNKNVRTQIPLPNNRSQEKKVAEIPTERHQVAFGYVNQVSLMNVNINGGSNFSKKQAYEAAQHLDYGFVTLGAVIDLRSFIKTPYDISIKFGILIGLSADGTVSNVPELSESRYSFKQLGDNSQVLTSAFGLGFQVWKDRLSIGISPGAQAAFKGNIEVTNINLDKSDPADLNIKVDAKSKPAPVGALIYRHPLVNGDQLFIGFVYRSVVKVESEIDLKTVLPLNLQSESATLAKGFISPETFTFGLGYFLDQSQFSLDIEWQRWSAFKVNPARASFEDALNYQDVWALRFGFEAPLSNTFFKNTKIRSGYALVTAFTPNQNGRSNYLDNDKHLFGVGISWLFGKNTILKKGIVFDASFQWQWWQTRESRKNTEGSLQPDYSYGGHVFVSALSLTIII